ncbi:MAG: hypothetical protein NVSMB44_31790 [Ktedonobacteraceae bacterium]
MTNDAEKQARRNFLKVGVGAVGLSALTLAPSATSVAQAAHATHATHTTHAATKARHSGGGLPTGIWDIDANGYHGTLQIYSYDTAGNLDATLLFNGEPVSEVVGFYDDVSQKVFFDRVIDRDNPTSYQIYTGYLIQELSGITLTGFFETFAPGSAARYTYGWYATFRG